MSDKQRAAIITGSSRGIGAAIAERLANDGLAVVINYSGEAAPAEELAEKIKTGGGKAMVFRADISDATAVSALFDAAEQTFGAVDVLVNNAGIMKLAPLAKSDAAFVDRQLDVNLKGTINTLREAAGRLRDGGRIVNFSSSVVGLYPPGYAIYAATKAATEAMTHILAKELGSRGITVNAVAPGPVATSLFLDGQNRRADRADEEDQPSGTPRRARRHRKNGVVSCEPRRRLDQRSDSARQWRRDLIKDRAMTMTALITGASSGFGEMIARDLADAGHVAYASMRDTVGRNATKVSESAAYAAQHDVDLRTVELDVQDDTSIEAAVASIIDEHGRLDIVVHNAGHMVYGPSEAFTANQLAQLYDINVLGTQRVNRAVLPYMREARSGLMIWISSTSVGGGVPPLLGPYFAAKAGMDALAVCYAKELAPFGIETSIVVPGAFTTGTNHFANSGKPADDKVMEAYVEAYPDGFMDSIQSALAATVPRSADPGAVGRAVTDIVKTSPGRRPLRVFIDPANDGAATTFGVMDRVRRDFLARIGYADLLHPATQD